MLTIKSLIPFLTIAFGLTWGLVGLGILFPKDLEALFGEVKVSNPLFILAVYSPAIAAFILVLRAKGISGLNRFLSRILLWRCARGWYLLLIFGVPLVYYFGALLKGNLSPNDFTFSISSQLLFSLVLMLFLGPIEEFGWRGFALPLLQQKFAPFWAGLILGFIWGLWHLPAFALGGTPQSEWLFLPFFIGLAAVSVIVTPLFNSSGGSILLPFLFHFQLNNPVFPDAQPYDTFLYVGAATVVVLINRKTMFTKNDAVTEVIPLFEAVSPDEQQNQKKNIDLSKEVKV